jgi:uncharacterized protein YecT (DUF1311 family)
MAAALLFLSGPQAQSSEPSVDCRQGGVTQFEMNVCAGRKAARQKKKLTALLNDLKQSLEPEKWQELHDLQAAWVTLRDRDCRWETSFAAGGSIAPLVSANCVANLTRERIARLKIFLCEGQGLTGPCDASRKY